MKTLIALLALLGLAACHAAPSSETPSGATAPPDAVYRQLAQRHAVPCAALDASPETLLDIAEHTTAPPWAGMRAATCLIRHHAAWAAPHLRRWRSDPRTAGLGRLVELHLPRAPTTPSDGALR